MKLNRSLLLAVAVVFASSGFVVGAPPKLGASITDPAVQNLLGSIPLRDKSTTKEKITEALLQLNKEQLTQLVDAIDVQGRDNEDRARFALHGLATVITKENLASRKALAEACAKRLASDADPSIKVFLIETLELAGAVEAIPFMAVCLKDKATIDSTVRAMETLGGDDARAALRTALAAATDNRLPLIQGLGWLQDTASVTIIRPFLADKDTRTRVGAAESLSEMGDAESFKAIEAMLDQAGDYERAQLTSAELLMARRLVELKKVAEADAIYQAFWDRKPQELRHERIAGLEGLVTTRGEGALPLVLGAMESPDWQMRAAAVRIGVKTPGEKVTKMFIDQLAKSKNPVEVLAILTSRKDPSSFSAVSAMLSNKDEKVQVAAIRAAAATGGEKAIKPLLEIAASGSTATRGAAIAALGSSPNAEGDAILAEHLNAADTQGKLLLLDVLALRSATSQQTAVAACLKNPDERVRIAAIATLEKIGDVTMEEPLIATLSSKAETERTAGQKALVAVARRVPDENARIKPMLAALPTAGDAKVPLLNAMALSGSKAATATFITLTKDANADVQDAAIRALASKSTDTAALSALLDIAKMNADESYKVIAMQGYLRIVDTQVSDKNEKLKLYTAALPLAARPEEKRVIIGGLGKLDAPAAMDAAAALLDEETLRDEAALAVVTIAQKNIQDPERIRAAVEKAASAAKNGQVKQQAQGLLNRLPKKKA